MHFEFAQVFAARAAEIVARETRRILAVLPGAAVEHVGGTAVPGGLTKGDVDLAVRVTAEDFGGAVEALKRLYAIHQPENWTPTLASFKDASPSAEPLGVQLVVRGSRDDFFSRYRDRLIADPAALAASNEIKRRHEGADPAVYRAAKTRFIELLLAERAAGEAAATAPVVIRPAVDEELSELFALARESFLAAVAPLYSAEGVATFMEYATAEAGAQRHRDGHSTYAAAAGAKLVGMAHVRGGSHLAMLFVAPAWQRRGIGRELMRAVVSASPADIVTVNSSPNAAESYLKFGFKPVAEEQVKRGIRFIPMVYRRTGAG